MLQEHIIKVESPLGENKEKDTFWITYVPLSNSQVDFNNHIWKGMQRLHQSSQRAERDLRQTRAEFEELRRFNLVVSLLRCLPPSGTEVSSIAHLVG